MCVCTGQLFGPTDNRIVIYLQETAYVIYFLKSYTNVKKVVKLKSVESGLNGGEQGINRDAIACFIQTVFTHLHIHTTIRLLNSTSTLSIKASNLKLFHFSISFLSSFSYYPGFSIVPGKNCLFLVYQLLQ